MTFAVPVEDLSPVEQLALAPQADQAEALRRLSIEERAALLTWRGLRRASQCPPVDDDWLVWFLMAGRGAGKRLALSTPIPTSTGWSKMGDLAVGDEVFDESGRVCHVVAISDGWANAPWRLLFSDGSWVDACEEHLWVTWDATERKALNRAGGTKHTAGHDGRSGFPAEWPLWRSATRWGSGLGLIGPQIRTTEQIALTLVYGKRGDRNHSIPVAGPLECPSLGLPLDPYVLGAWLGDGERRAGTMSGIDEGVFDEIRSAGFDIGPIWRGAERSGSRTIYGLTPILRGMRLLNAKHVPAVYLRASVSQRLALLQGLMDTDGSVGRGRAVEFTSVDRVLVDAVVELARSLGQKPVLAEGVATLNGRITGPKFRVTWRPTIDVFRLQRKRANVPDAQALRSHHRMIIGAERVEPQVMRCITVDSSNAMYLCGEAMIPTHNTRAAAEDVIDRVTAIGEAEYGRWCVVTPTFGDFRDVAVEGESGLLSVLLRRGIEHEWNRSHGELRTPRWTIQGYSSEKPDRLRGPQHHGAWLDEPGSYRWPKLLWDTLLPSLRLGRKPKVLVTGTPKVTWLIRHLVSEAKVNPARYRLSRATTYRNAANLPADILEELTRAFGNSNLGRQELHGELLEEAEGALWKLLEIDGHRAIDPADRTDMTPPGYVDLPDVRDLRISMGVDPAVTNTADSDETGIIVAGAQRGPWPHGYVLADLSGRMSMEGWGRRVIDACVTYGTTRVVAEANQGGDLVVSNINTARREGDPWITVEKVHAKKSKALRAGPIATLYEQGRVHHFGSWGELETQMVTWVPGDELPGQDSPDRVDALVYALLDLMDVPVVGGQLAQFSGTLRGR